MTRRCVVVRRRLLVSGRVQGVGFRASCARRAAELGLAGRVRNLADGRVEVVAEGRPEAVEALLAWCRFGPRLAQVAEVQVNEEEPTGADTFIIS